MTQQEKEKGKIPSTKGILAWVREILHLKAPEMKRAPAEPSPEVITSLIAKASGEKLSVVRSQLSDSSENRKRKTENENPTSENGQRKTENESCPYALKRNLVESLREIKKFAEENDLAATMVRALLSLLAEMAVGALKGKVSSTILDSLLKVFNYEREKEEYALRLKLEKEEAYRQGVIDGRNARIEIEEFPAVTEDVPNLKGNIPPASSCQNNIFKMASEA